MIYTVMEAAKGMPYLLEWHGDVLDLHSNKLAHLYSNHKVEPGRRYSQPMLLSIYSFISLLEKAFINGTHTQVFVSESAENPVSKIQKFVLHHA